MTAPTMLHKGRYFESRPRRHGGGRRPANYPDKCPQCRRLVRPPSAIAEDWPGTVKAVRADGTCHTCKRGAGNSNYVARSERPFQSLSAEEQDERVARAREEYDMMVRDRRARGIHPDGIVFTGDGAPIRSADSKIEIKRMERQARTLEEKQARTERARAERLSRPYALKDLCPKGHLKTKLYYPGGQFRKTRCYSCEWEQKKARREELLQQARQGTIAS